MLYFAYGSNMAAARLQRRIPSAQRISVARLTGYHLRFHVASSIDGSAKCDAFRTKRPEDTVLGVLFRIDPADKPVLDGYESAGELYRDTFISVAMGDGQEHEALIYLGTCIDPTLQPYSWYREHVVRGARENCLPADYVESILSVDALEDPDQQRAAMELSIYE